MKVETLTAIFEMFFGELQYEIINDEFKTKLYSIEFTVKNVVEYSKSNNHIEVYSVDLEMDELYCSIIEGSPQDIIKLSKILQ